MIINRFPGSGNGGGGIIVDLAHNVVTQDQIGTYSKSYLVGNKVYYINNNGNFSVFDLENGHGFESLTAFGGSSDYESCGVVYNGEIYHLRAYGANAKEFKKWNGSSWETLTAADAITGFYGGQMAVLNGVFYVFGSNGDGNQVWKYQNGSWSKVTTAPFLMRVGTTPIAWNGYIWCANPNSATSYLYRFNGSTFTKVSGPEDPTGAASRRFLYVKDNKLHLALAINTSSYSYCTYMIYAYNGSAWSAVAYLSDLPGYLVQSYVGIANEDERCLWYSYADSSRVYNKVISEIIV